MAARKTAKKDPVDAAKTAGDAAEQQVVALAEQLGGLLGSMRAKADGWLDRDALLGAVGRIRDGAAGLLDDMTRARQKSPKAAAPSPAAPLKRASRGAVDAPGKRHRKPPPQERLDRRMGEPVGKKMGQKSPKGRIRSGRG